jgi:hypothetical protein
MLRCCKIARLRRDFRFGAGIARKSEMLATAWRIDLESMAEESRFERGSIGDNMD